MAYVLAMSQHRSKLQRVLPGEVKGAGHPCFNPFKTIGASRFIAEVVTLVACGRQHHLGCSLRRYTAIHRSAGDRALQHPASNGEPVGEGEGGLVEIGVRGHGLRIEVIESDILLGMRSVMETPGQGVVGSKDRIELRERVECL